jgi:AcrR family transcriptional regulator
MDKDGWVNGALEAIREGGLAAVAVEPLARRLGVTKGSFYWHFAGRDDLIAAAIDRWEREHGASVDQITEGAQDARDALDRLIDAAIEFSTADSIYARLILEPGDERVTAAIERVAAGRIDAIAVLYRALGLGPAAARARATVAYGAFIGLQRLRRGAAPGRAGALRGELRAALLAGI